MTGFESREGLGFFLFATALRPAPVPTPPLIQWVQVIFPRRVKQPEREADHSPPPSAEDKSVWKYHDPLIRLHDVVPS
jgi:hypothetical protein